MNTLNDALRGALGPSRAALRPLPSVLVAGGGGTLGSALLAEALVAGRFQRVTALVEAPLASTLRGLRPLALQQLMSGDELHDDLAFVVFERDRHANGRDEAFVRPQAQDLLPLARALRGAGVQRLLVVVPHAPALLPHALKAGFASHDEAAVAALGFEQLVFVRASQDRQASNVGQGLQRLAAWWLSQLRWMVPQADQPVRAVRLAQLLVHCARLLPGAPPGTRVLPPELLQQAATADDPELALTPWLQRTGHR